MSARFAIDAGREVFERLAHEQARDAAGELDHFDTALHFGAGFSDGFAVLPRHEGGQLLDAFLHQFAKAEHDARPLHRRRLAPGGERLGGGANRPVDLGGRAKRHLGLHPPRRGIVNVAAPIAGRTLETPADQERNDL